MEKLTCDIYGQFKSYSSLSTKSRLFAHDIIELRPDWDIHLIDYLSTSVRTGLTDEFIDSYCGPARQNPDICITFGEPAVLQISGKINIGVVDPCDISNNDQKALFIDQCNKMSIIFVYSEYGRNTLTELRMFKNETEYKIQTPILVLPEYSQLTKKSIIKNLNDINIIDNKWNFLIEGPWYLDEPEFAGKNRCNFNFVINCFLHTFNNINNAPGLIINTHGESASMVDLYNLQNRINELKNNIHGKTPDIYLINGDFNQEELYSFYNNDKIKAYIDVTQRTDNTQKELDFTSTGKPMILSNWQVFKKLNNSVLVDGGLKRIIDDKQDNPIVIDITWVELKAAFYDMFYHYKELLEASKINSQMVLANNNREMTLKILDNIFNAITNEFIKDQ